MIHALADGIAMGASANSTDEQLRWIVFGAILIHKAPTAFGLCSVLMARGLSKPDTLKALALFSLCTPIGAIVIYLGLQLLFNFNKLVSSSINLFTATAATAAAAAADTAADGSSSTNLIRQLSIGATLTFSGGTFLFVAMHALEDVTDSPGPDAGVGAEPSSGPLLNAGSSAGSSTSGGHDKGKTAQFARYDDNTHDLPHEYGQHRHQHHDRPRSMHQERMGADSEVPMDVEHEAERWEYETRRRVRAPSSASSESSVQSRPRSRASSEASGDLDSVVREKSIVQAQVESVPQPARIALVFLGCLIPKSLQLVTGGHSH